MAWFHALLIFGAIFLMGAAFGRWYERKTKAEKEYADWRDNPAYSQLKRTGPILTEEEMAMVLKTISDLNKAK